MLPVYSWWVCVRWQSRCTWNRRRRLVCRWPKSKSPVLIIVLSLHALASLHAAPSTTELASSTKNRCNITSIYIWMHQSRGPHPCRACGYAHLISWWYAQNNNSKTSLGTPPCLCNQALVRKGNGCTERELRPANFQYQGPPTCGKAFTIQRLPSKSWEDRSTRHRNVPPSTFQSQGRSPIKFA